MVKFIAIVATAAVVGSQAQFQTDLQFFLVAVFNNFDMIGFMDSVAIMTKTSNELLDILFIIFPMMKVFIVVSVYYSELVNHLWIIKCVTMQCYQGSESS